MFLLLSCSTPTFIEALEGDPDLCLQLNAAPEQGECLATHAVGRAKRGEQAEAYALCQRIEGDWHDECVFRTTDALELVGPEAFKACEDAGHYSDQCAGHAATRMVAAMDDLPLEVGQEQALIREIGRRVGEWPVHHRETVKRTGITRHVADRFDGTFDVAGCGKLPAPLCQLAYAETMRQDATLQREAMCHEPRTSASVQAAGGTAWTAPSDAIVQAALADLCRSWTGAPPTDAARGPKR